MSAQQPPASPHDPPKDAPAGQAYWRSLEEYADTPAFRRSVAEEFPGYDPDELLSMSRRKFMKLAGASMALAGLTLTGCRRWPEETLAPYANRPDLQTPGEPVWYASMQERSGVASGILVKAFDGRPIKTEGNPDHPVSPNGASDTFVQASVLSMYDPHRSRRVLQAGQEGGEGDARQRPVQWSTFENFLRGRASQLSDGSGLAILSEPTSSPTVQRLRSELQQRHPQMTWATWEPVHRDNEWAGAQQALGQVARPQYDFAAAKIIACFDADPLAGHPDSLRLARGWAQGRKSADEGRMNRVYMAEPSFSPTGTAADERIALRPSRIGAVLQAVASELGASSGGGGELTQAETTFARHLAEDLQANAGESIVMVGPNQPAAVHALGHAINAQLGNLGSTITFTEEPLAGDGGQGYTAQLQQLTERMAGGEIDTLLILGGNPVFDAPAGVDFTTALAEVPNSVHLSLYNDETSRACDWHVNQAHPLESWGDGRAWEGTLSVQQPQILPLYDGKTPAELLAFTLGDGPTGAMEITQQTFASMLGESGSSFVRRWREILHNGLLADSGFSTIDVSFSGDAPNVPQAPNVAAEITGSAASNLEVVFNPHATIYDGRFANNGWMQEAPEPVTKLTWDNPARMAVKDAHAMGLGNGDMIELTVDGRTMRLPIFMMQGQSPGVIHLTFGHGRTAAGPVGGQGDETVGFNTYPLRPVAAQGFATGAEVRPAYESYELAATQNNHLIDSPVDLVAQYNYDYRLGEKNESGSLIKEASLAEYRRNHGFAHEGHGAGDLGRDISLQLYEPPPATDAAGENPRNPEGPKYFNQPHAWGMAIDMNSCFGCNACVIGCQSENNIPVVGKEEVTWGREMHWLRIDTYYKGDPEDASDVQAVHQPLACVQCENAPCEQVCPVAATVHDTEGLNTMIYNRCIGTRYCSNNCPYKVRRFNYLDYHARDFDSLRYPWPGIPDQEQQTKVNEITRMRFNPDVTVRMRGVMEKCTYCVQRISRAKIQAGAAHQQGERESELLRDGEVVTACQSACPTNAIVFGDLNDPNSEVSRLQQQNHRSYKLLDVLNTRARTQHLAKIRNPYGQEVGAHDEGGGH